MLEDNQRVQTLLGKSLHAHTVGALGALPAVDLGRCGPALHLPGRESRGIPHSTCQWRARRAGAGAGAALALTSITPSPPARFELTLPGLSTGERTAWRDKEFFAASALRPLVAVDLGGALVLRVLLVGGLTTFEGGCEGGQRSAVAGGATRLKVLRSKLQSARTSNSTRGSKVSQRQVARHRKGRGDPTHECAHEATGTTALTRAPS